MAPKPKGAGGAPPPKGRVARGDDGGDASAYGPPAGLGWNPYLLEGGPGVDGPAPASVNAPLPKHMRQDKDIQQLCDLYQQQLAELNACHSLLQVDQERLAAMLAPFVNAQGQLVMQEPDPNVLLFKEGLDLRLKEFEEDCKRIQQIERKLQQKIEEATDDYENTVQDVSYVADNRILKRLREQHRLIEIQQQEIDQVRFEKELLQKETMRLREITKYGHYTDDGIQMRLQAQLQREERLYQTGPQLSLHQAYEANTPARPPHGAGTNMVIHQAR